VAGAFGVAASAAKKGAELPLSGDGGFCRSIRPRHLCGAAALCADSATLGGWAFACWRRLVASDELPLFKRYGEAGVLKAAWYPGRCWRILCAANLPLYSSPSTPCALPFSRFATWRAKNLRWMRLGMRRGAFSLEFYRLCAVAADAGRRGRIFLNWRVLADLYGGRLDLCRAVRGMTPYACGISRRFGGARRCTGGCIHAARADSGRLHRHATLEYWRRGRCCRHA